MAINTSLYQIGQRLTAVNLTGLTISKAGVVTDSATVIACTVRTDDLDVQISRILEEITPINSGSENFVKTINGYSFAITILKVDAIGGAQVDPSPFFTETVNNNFDYWKLVYVNGISGGSEETVTIYGIINNIGDGVHGKGRQTSPTTFNSIDISGGATPVTRVVA